MRWTWHFGLGRELGYAFWALTFFEGVFGAYIAVWPLWIERLGAPISVIGLVLGASGLIRPFVLGPGSVFMSNHDTRKILIGARSLSIAGLVLAAFATSWPLLLITVLTSSIGELVFPAIQTYVADNAADDPVHAFTMVITIGPAIALIVTPLISSVVIAIGGIPAALILAALLTAIGLGFVSRMEFTGGRAAIGAAEKTSYRLAMAHTGIRTLMIVHALTIGVLAVGSSLVSNFLEIERGFAPSLVSLLSAGAAVGTVTYGFLVSRHSGLRRAPITAASIACALTAMGYLLLATQTWLPLVALALVFRGGLFSTWSLFLGALGSIAPAHLRARSFTIMEILGGSAMSFGPIVASQLWKIDPRAPFIVSALSSLVMVGVLIGVRHRQELTAPAAAPAPSRG